MIGKKGVVDFMVIVGFYFMFGFILNSFDIFLDGDIVQELMCSFLIV